MSLNKERLAAVLDFIERYPELHSQRYWITYAHIVEGYEADCGLPEPDDATSLSSCGTACCVAGHTVIMFGKKGTLFTRWQTVPKRAARILGLTRKQAEYLFATDRTLDEMKRFLKSGGVVRKGAGRVNLRAVYESR